MNARVTLLGLVFAAFAVPSLYAMYQVGYLGIWQAGWANWGAAQILLDLVVACGLICVWMVADARRHGLNPWPFLGLTLVSGSFGPLLYLMRRELAARPAASAASS